MRLFFRIITLLCYFLPFTYFLSTCNRGPWDVTFNKQNGEKILADTAHGLREERIENSAADTTITITVDTLRDSSNNITIVRDTLVPKSKRPANDASHEITLDRFIFPTRTSISGIGFIIVPDNDLARFPLGLSLIITLISLIVFIITKRRKIVLALLWANVPCIVAFMVCCFVSNITLLFGSWAVLMLLLIQIYLEYKNKRGNYEVERNQVILILMIFCFANFGFKKKASKSSSDKHLNHSSIKVVKTSFPLYLSRISFAASYQFNVSQNISSKIKSVIEDYYYNICNGDSSETHLSLQNVYYNTIEVSNDTLAAYLILLDNSGLQTSKILLFDKRKQSFYKGIFDFYIGPLYNFGRKTLKPSNLKRRLKIDDPEIALLNFGKDNINAIKLTRLYHNGTFNAVETKIMKCSNPMVDTLFFQRKWIY